MMFTRLCTGLCLFLLASVVLGEENATFSVLSVHDLKPKFEDFQDKRYDFDSLDWNTNDSFVVMVKEKPKWTIRVGRHARFNFGLRTKRSQFIFFLLEFP